MIEVFSSGGGTQSTAISVLIHQGKLPKPDFMVIADTGREMPTTWEYMDQVTAPKMREIGIEVHRVKASEWAARWGREVFASSGQIIIPAFSNHGGGSSKLSAFCSSAWKSESVNRWFRIRHEIKRSQMRKWIGFSFDETRRILKMQNGKEWKKGLIRFPLVHDIPTRRHQAIKVVLDAGWPEPPRSRCWMCPNQSDREWAEVEERPKLFSEAVALDEAIRERDPNAFLHSSIKPLKDADLTAPDDLFSGSCASGECFL